MKIGYARVSTDDQNLDLQIDALNLVGCEQIYKEYASGKNTKARPELDNCLKSLRAGDTLVVWRLDRLGRSLSDLVMIVTELEDKNIGFESLTEKIDTTTSTGKFVFHVFAALAEFERNIIRERTMAGMKAARARGKLGGRPPKLTEGEMAIAKSLINANEIPITQIAKQLGISRATFYRLFPTDTEDKKGHKLTGNLND